jgi:hypothetical protein
MLKPVKPGQVKNALDNALARHGIPQATADSVWYDLTTGNDPRPVELPQLLTFKGLHIAWPAGRHTRLLDKSEVSILNTALRTCGVPKSELLDREDTAEDGRRAYKALYHRMHRDDYDATPITLDRLAALVEEEQREQVVVEHAATNVKVVRAQPRKPKKTKPVQDVALDELDTMLADLEALTNALTK